MFDIGFSELVVVGVVALLVLGPERLPRVARTVGHLLGRVQRYVSDIKADINREIQFEDLKKLRAEVAQSAHDVENTIHSEMQNVQASLNVGDHGNPVETDRAQLASESPSPQSGDAAPKTSS